MEPVERLTGYLAGELPADEVAAVERDLARDPALRATLADLRRADDALTRIPPVSPPEGFEDRLAARVDEVLTTEVIGPVGASEGGEVVDLGARRGRWPGAGMLAAAAAAVVGLVVVGGVVVGNPFGGGDDAGTESMSLDVAGDAAESGPAAPTEAPVVVDDGREIDGGNLGDVSVAPRVEEIAERRLDADAGAVLAADFARSLGAPLREDADGPGEDSGTPEEARPDEDGDGESDGPATMDGEAAPQADDDAGGVAPLTTRDGRMLDQAESAQVARCLDELLTEQVTAIPAYVEVATVDGARTLVFGLVTLDPATDAFTRVETWLVEADDCHVVHFRAQ